MGNLVRTSTRLMNISSVVHSFKPMGSLSMPCQPLVEAHTSSSSRTPEPCPFGNVPSFRICRYQVVRCVVKVRTSPVVVRYWIRETRHRSGPPAACPDALR